MDKLLVSSSRLKLANNNNPARKYPALIMRTYKLNEGGALLGERKLQREMAVKRSWFENVLSSFT